MAKERLGPLQDQFLDHLRETNLPVIMFLVNGVKLQGHVERFDKFSVQLTRGNSSQIIFKHAISAIYPEAPIQRDWAGEPKTTTELDER
jgi:host factor-I protein